MTDPVAAAEADFFFDPENNYITACRYTPPSGTPVDFDGLFDESTERGQLVQDREGDRIIRRAQLTVRAAVNGGNDFSTDGKLTIPYPGGEAWLIKGTSGRDTETVTYDLVDPDWKDFRGYRGIR